MISNTYRFQVTRLSRSKWTICAVHLDGGGVVELAGLYVSRHAAEANLPRVSSDWLDAEKLKF